MPVAAILPVLAKGVIGAAISRKASSGANARGDALSAEAVKSAEALQKTATAMGERSDERWNFYKEYGENVDIMLIDDAVSMFKETFSGGSELAAARAAEDVASAFDRSAEVRRRAAFRFGGVDPTSGKFQGLERKTATQRATAEASARFRARRSEEDRARSTLQNASNLANRAIGQGQDFARIGANTENAAAKIFSGQVTDAREDAAGSAALVGDIAGKIPFDKIFSGIAGAFSGGGGDDAVSESGDSDLKEGGVIKRYRKGGAIPGDGRAGGKLVGPGTGRSDSINATVDGRRNVRLSSGEFIIPAHVVRRKGERFFNKMIGRG